MDSNKLFSLSFSTKWHSDFGWRHCNELPGELFLQHCLGFIESKYQRFPWFRIAYFILWTCFIVIFQWILHAYIFLRWPYPFLDLSKKLFRGRNNAPLVLWPLHFGDKDEALIVV